MRITAAQPLVPGPEGGQLEPMPLLSPAEAEAEAAATFAEHISCRMLALDEMPPDALGQPLEHLLTAGELGIYTHRLTMVEAPAYVCREYLVRVEP